MKEQKDLNKGELSTLLLGKRKKKKIFLVNSELF